MTRRFSLLSLSGGLVFASCHWWSPRDDTPVLVPAGLTSAAVSAAGRTVNWVGCSRADRRTTSGSNTTSVEICAASYAHRYPQPHETIPGNGVYIGRIVNLGSTYRELRWRIAPLDTVYVVLRSPPSGRFRYRILDAVAGLADSVATLEESEWFNCGHTRRHTRSRAEFRYCKDDPPPSASRSPGATPIPVRSFAPMLRSFESDVAGGPGWFSCPEGCCGTDQRVM